MIISSSGISQTPDILKPMENELLEETGGCQVVWCGRAATSLLVAYRAIRRLSGNIETPEVILPAMMCATPANTIYLADLTPRFADVNLQTGLMTLESIKARWTPRTCAVVFVHLFGQTADLIPIANWCRERKILLIEDAAQAQGAKLPGGGAVGTIGDFTVYSFNNTKILECGGGALVVRNPELSESLEAELNLPLPETLDPQTATDLGIRYRDTHHGMVALYRLRLPQQPLSQAFMEIRADFDGLYFARLKDATLLAETQKKMPGILKRRRAKAAIYEKELTGGPWSLLSQWRISGVCWRYSLLVDFPDRQVSFSALIRKDGFHVSNLYWPINQFFNPADECPNADAFARKIVNLWVDDSVDEDWVKRCCTSINKNGRQFRHNTNRSK